MCAVLMLSPVCVCTFECSHAFLSLCVCLHRRERHRHLRFSLIYESSKIVIVFLILLIICVKYIVYFQGLAPGFLEGPAATANSNKLGKVGDAKDAKAATAGSGCPSDLPWYSLSASQLAALDASERKVRLVFEALFKYGFARSYNVTDTVDAKTNRARNLKNLTQDDVTTVQHTQSFTPRPHCLTTLIRCCTCWISSGNLPRYIITLPSSFLTLHNYL